MKLQLGSRLWDPPDRTLVMGILNVTPDSFSDGGRFADIDRAVAHASRMIEDGADLIDIGGESTRPGSAYVSAAEQIRRVRPVVERIRADHGDVVISVDTRLAEVAAAALDAGANLINDVSALQDDPDLGRLAAERKAPVILMHMPGDPGTMQSRADYGDVVVEVRDFLSRRVEAAAAAGIDRSRLIVDPGIGFGKRTGHNLEILNRIDILRTLGLPILLGPSRKGFIGKVTGVEDPEDRLAGTVAVAAYAASRGVEMVRVHDVGAVRQAVDLISAILQSGLTRTDG